MALLQHPEIKNTDYEDNDFSQSISQCIDPLNNAYKSHGWWSQAKWPNCTSITRYFVLFL